MGEGKDAKEKRFIVQHAVSFHQRILDLDTFLNTILQRASAFQHLCLLNIVKQTTGFGKPQ